MVIADAISEAETEYVVYFLLEAYLNTASRRAALKGVSDRIIMLPLTGRHDTKLRFALLTTELAEAAGRHEEEAGAAIKEAAMVFGAALQRLESLERKRPLAARSTHHDKQSYGYAAGLKASSQA
jgi:ADP-ribosylglycohydrolase